MAVKNVEYKYARKKSQQAHPDCKFCKKIRAKKDILFENDHIVVMFGRPHHKGHLVVMPKVHEENLLKLHENTLDSFTNDTVRVMKALGKIIKPDLFNLEYLDNWDHHIHWHIYPRFKSDPDWGNPPVIPPKDSNFKPRKLSKKEMTALKKEIDRIRVELW